MNHVTHTLIQMVTVVIYSPSNCKEAKKDANLNQMILHHVYDHEWSHNEGGIRLCSELSGAIGLCPYKRSENVIKNILFFSLV